MGGFGKHCLGRLGWTPHTHLGGGESLFLGIDNTNWTSDIIIVEEGGRYHCNQGIKAKTISNRPC